MARRCAPCSPSAKPPLAAIWEVLVNAPAVHWDILRQDLRYTARTLLARRGFTAVAILVLALGIGANTAVFSVTDYVLIRPLPFPAANRLVKVWENLPGYPEMELSPADYRDWKKMNTVFEDMGGVTGVLVNLTGEGNPERIEAARVTGSLFATLGVKPLLGRPIISADDRQARCSPRSSAMACGNGRSVATLACWDERCNWTAPPTWSSGLCLRRSVSRTRTWSCGCRFSSTPPHSPIATTTSSSASLDSAPASP
jgi:hypothetical protein